MIKLMIKNVVKESKLMLVNVKKVKWMACDEMIETKTEVREC